MRAQPGAAELNRNQAWAAKHYSNRSDVPKAQNRAIKQRFSTPILCFQFVCERPKPAVASHSRQIRTVYSQGARPVIADFRPRIPSSPNPQRSVDTHFNRACLQSQQVMTLVYFVTKWKLSEPTQEAGCEADFYSNLAHLFNGNVHRGVPEAAALVVQVIWAFRRVS